MSQQHEFRCARVVRKAGRGHQTGPAGDGQFSDGPPGASGTSHCHERRVIQSENLIAHSLPSHKIFHNKPIYKDLHHIMKHHKTVTGCNFFQVDRPESVTIAANTTSVYLSTA